MELGGSPELSPFSEAYGFETSVFVRSLAELTEVSKKQPFTNEELAASERRIQISFMQAAPGKRAISDVLALVPPDERVVFSGREWFWLPLRGISDSQLPVAAIERLVGPMTVRTAGTVKRMVDKFP
ncbi:MAG: DUF1697 domain-containing protein [Acidimicrobiia bacterium]|nr:DUF1697 domain-containing protein [Acidimicrobiia bacterium]